MDELPKKSTSPWMEMTPDELRYPQLSGEQRADVVVIGAGIAGLTAAWQLARAGGDVLVVEKNHVASGDTGYTTSFITRMPDTMLGPIAKKHGPEFMRRVFAATREAQAFLFGIITEQQIECDFVRCHSFFGSYADPDPVLAQEWAAVKDAGTNARLMMKREAAEMAPFVQAIQFPGEGHFDVRQFLLGLLQRPVGKRIRIFEETEATAIEPDADGVRVRTRIGLVHAQRVLVATGRPQPGWPGLNQLIKQVVTYALQAEYQDEVPIANHIFWDTDQPYQYFRRRGPRRIILGGADRPAGSSVPPDSTPHEHLHRFLRHRLPGDFQVTHRWSGSIFETADGLPYVFSHPHFRRRVFVATGFSGCGMVLGTLSGLLLADAAREKTNVHAPVFSLARTGVKIPQPASRQRPSMDIRPLQPKATPIVRLLRLILPLGALTVFVIPAYIFFDQRGGLSFLQGLTFPQANLLLFPLIGLYAFTLVWLQVMIGTTRGVLRRVFPGVITFHRREGVFALLFALLHPTMRAVGIGPGAYLKNLSAGVAPEYVFFLWLGYVQLLVMIVTAGTALLRNRPWLKRHWHTIHYANYAVFIMVWFHSWYLGSDIQGTNLRYLWFFFAGTVGMAILWRFIFARRFEGRNQTAVPRSVPAVTSAPAFVAVASIDQVAEGKPFCSEVGGQQIAVFKAGDQFYAMDNVCSHAGGPLCEGFQEGMTIECPLHASKFDLRTGAVLSPPARVPQKLYPVRLSGRTIEIQVAG